MGKVLSSFTNGFPGAIARAVDDIVISVANQSGDPIPFGTPVMLSNDRTGVVRFNPVGKTAADFIGVTVRNPSKTPDTYGDNEGTYAPDDIVDVLVRGHIAVKLAGTGAAVGGSVGVNADGFTAATGTGIVTLDSAHITALPDANGIAEIVLNTRNLI